MVGIQATSEVSGSVSTVNKNESKVVSLSQLAKDALTVLGIAVISASFVLAGGERLVADALRNSRMGNDLPGNKPAENVDPFGVLGLEREE